MAATAGTISLSEEQASLPIHSRPEKDRNRHAIHSPDKWNFMKTADEKSCLYLTFTEGDTLPTATMHVVGRVDICPVCLLLTPFSVHGQEKKMKENKEFAMKHLVSLSSLQDYAFRCIHEGSHKLLKLPAVTRLVISSRGGGRHKGSRPTCRVNRICIIMQSIGTWKGK